MKKMIIWILIAALCLTGCMPALAATGDRILAHFNNNDGYLSTYISNVFQTEDGICAYLNGQQEKIAVYGEGTEPKEYTLEMEAFLNVDQEEGEASVYVQTAGWFSWNGELYAVQYHNVSMGESSTIEGGFVKKAKLADGTILLEDCDIPQLDWSGMVEDYGGWQGSRYLNRLLVSGDSLIGTTWDNNGQNLLVMFDLTTGFVEEIPLQDVEGIYPGPDGTLLMTRYEWAEEIRIHIIRFSPADQSEEELGTVSYTDGQMQSLCWDEKTSTLYYVLSGEIFAAKDLNLETAEAVSDCPMTYDVSSMILDDGRMLMWNSTAIVIRNLDPAAKDETFTLTIQDFAYSDSLAETNYDFSDARGDASVILRQGGDSSTILQAMMNRDAQTDIYTLQAQSSEFDALRSRGFLADMSGNEALSAAADRMVPYVQEAVRQDGKLIAVPVSMYGYAFGYRPEIWEKLGGTEEELPQTWEQFFDWLNTLPARVEGTDYAIFDTWLDQDNFRVNLVDVLLGQYQLYINEEDREYAFNTPLLRGLLARMDEIDYDALGIKERDMDDEGGMISYEYRQPLLEMYTTTTIESWSSGAKPMMLRLEDDAEAILPVTLSVAFVNPFSEHAEAAAEYLALSLKNLPLSTQYSIFTDEKEPIRDPYYEENVKSMQDWLEEAKTQLEQADEENRAMWEESVKSYEENLADMEKNSWMISGEAIEAYEARTSRIKVLTYDFASALVSSENGGSDYYSMLYGYAQKQVSPEELLSGIDKKVQMMRLEGN